MSEPKDQNQPTTSNAAETQAEQSKTNVAPAGAKETAGSQTSERKKEANRKNAKHSTGPRTGRGKDAIRYNALKHGFYASDVVLRQGDGQESQEEFDFLLEGLQRAWEPTDVMQHCLVRTIADSEWRLRRARRAEVGEIRRQTDSYYRRLLLNYLDDSGVADATLRSRPESKEALRLTTLSVTEKLAALREARKDVEQHGYVPDSIQTVLDRVFGKDDRLATECYRISRLAQHHILSEEEGNPDAGVEQALAGVETSAEDEGTDQYKKHLLGLIDGCAASLNRYLESLEQAEAREHEAALLAHNLPSREFVDKLIRYEAPLERTKVKAIELLLKLQANRK